MHQNPLRPDRCRLWVWTLGQTPGYVGRLPGDEDVVDWMRGRPGVVTAADGTWKRVASSSVLMAWYCPTYGQW